MKGEDEDKEADRVKRIDGVREAVLEDQGGRKRRRMRIRIRIRTE